MTKNILSHLSANLQQSDNCIRHYTSCASLHYLIKYYRQ